MFKNGPSKTCGKAAFKKIEMQRLFSKFYRVSMLEYLDPNVMSFFRLEQKTVFLLLTVTKTSSLKVERKC